MTTLPSFVELVSSLGLSAHTYAPEFPSTVSSLHPLNTTSSRTISQHRASPSRPHVTRYSPYLPALFYTRRGSLTSASPTTSESHQTMRASSTSPHLLSSPVLCRRNGSNIGTKAYRPVSDLTLNTPISTYVRRKTPSSSPTSPTFPPDHLGAGAPMPFSLPTLPTLFPQTTDSRSLPPTPRADV